MARVCNTHITAVFLFFIVTFCLPALTVAQNGLYLAQNSNTIRLNATQHPISGLSPSRFFAITGLFPNNHSDIIYTDDPIEKITVTHDSTSGDFLIKNERYNIQISTSSVFLARQYRKAFFEYAETLNWKASIPEADEERGNKGNFLDLRFDIPEEKRPAFTTIFGNSAVNLKVTGTASVNMGASVQNTANPAVPPDHQNRINPLFNQNLKLNVQGTVGDKLTISTDWNTQRKFDFENQVSIIYNGYEDEILKYVELGNVSMHTGNSLIKGGNELFGIKTVAEMGALRISTVLSQQSGETRTKTINGGSQERQILLRPADYQHNQHFFLDFFARQQFEENMSNPQQTGEALRLTEVNVWVFNETLDKESISGRRAIALVDLGTNRQGDRFFPPGNKKDPFSSELLNKFRKNDTGATAESFGVGLNDFHQGFYRPLQEGVDYEFSRRLGYISLNSPLQDNQALAVSYAYEQQLSNGETRRTEVGDVNVNPNASAERIYLKLLKPPNVAPGEKGWKLTMRNIYSLGSTGLKQNNVNLNLWFTRENVSQSNLPGRSTYLLQDLGLDRINTEGARSPDHLIDFGTGTLEAGSGRIIFPFLEPFGNRIVALIHNANVNEAQKQQLIRDIAFTELYNNKQADIRLRSAKNRFYKIKGTVKGRVSDNYFLGFALVKGSVKVFANGTRLQEGNDFNVDYSVGNITILNKRYLSPGQKIRIEYKNSQMAQIEQKNFTGVRAEYDVSNSLNIGSTIFRLKEKPLQEKVHIGNEPVNNTFLGFDVSGNFKLPWLNRTIDKIPYLNTKRPSSFSFNAEWAQLRPGVAVSNAVEEAISDNKLFSDEKRGLSFIDDFEGGETNISLMAPSRWSLAAAPALVTGYEPDRQFFEITGKAVNPSTSEADRIARSDLRSQFSWYSIPVNVESVLGNISRTPESRKIFIQDVFPQREVTQGNNTITTLDIYYNPAVRGQYNYNKNLKTLLEKEPERTWGGMTTTLPSGLQDLNQNNVEFLEFWVQSLLPGARQPAPEDLKRYEGKIYIELGTVSEDIIPNLRTNSEDGLADRPAQISMDNIKRSFITDISPDPDGQFSDETRKLEDTGLDGAPNTEQIEGVSEPRLFRDFLRRMTTEYHNKPEQLRKIKNDPSNDDYFYFGQDVLDGLPLQQRFYRMHGYPENNTPASRGDKRAVTNRPDSEGLLAPSSVERDNSYFQYEIDWNPADLKNLKTGAPGTYIVDQTGSVNDPQERRWYQVRIPLEAYVRKVGSIKNFQNISYIRVWMSGYEKPFTLRFATFEFTGSQWRKAVEVNQHKDNPIDSNVNFRISSVNIEENAGRRPIPYRKPPGSIRTVNRIHRRHILANEQSISLQVENLSPQHMRMIKRVYPGGLNLVNHSNMRMFIHGEGYRERENLEIVIRMGTDLVNNYYEYRQPVTPTREVGFNTVELRDIPDDVRLEEAKRIWKNEENGMNIVLSSFNQLKQLRNRAEVDPSKFVDLKDMEVNIGEMMKNAPPGATIGIKGNPSLDRITEIGLGIRNPKDPADPSSLGVQELKGEVWLNELRVSGFNDQKASATNLSTRFKLADFADVSTSFSYRSDGFGSLDSRLSDRRQFELTTFNLNGTVNLHKFLPSQTGWNLPVSISYRRSARVPRFLPNQGDIRPGELIQSLRKDEEISDVQTHTKIENQIAASKTFNESLSVNFSNISKKNSESKLARYTLDKTTLRFVFNSIRGHDPVFESRSRRHFDAAINYKVRFSKAKFVRPFGYLANSKFLSPLSQFRLGYAPSSINAGFGVNRLFRENKHRNQNNLRSLPVQQIHRFNYDTRFGFSYPLTPNMTTSFQRNSGFDLSNAGVRSIKSNNPADSSRFETIPTVKVFNKLLFGNLSSRRNNYTENYSLKWRPPLHKRKALEWLDYTARYSGQFTWYNSPTGSDLGATIGNSLRINQNMKINIYKIFDKITIHKNVNTSKQRERDTRQAEKAKEEEFPKRSDKTSFLRSIKKYGKKLLRSLFSMRSIDVNYSFNNSSHLPAFRGDAPIRLMFHSAGDDHFSPGFKFRTGISRDFSPKMLINNPDEDNDFTFLTSLSDNDNITMETSLVPFENFNIDLFWKTTWNKYDKKSVTITSQNEINSVLNQGGDVQASAWVFGNGYKKLFEKQLNTAYEDLSTDENGILVTQISDSLGNRDGRTVLNRDILQSDFKQAYLGGTGSRGERGFAVLPKPNWRITWSGLEQKISFLDDLFARLTLRHSYKGNYRLNWQFNPDAGAVSNRKIGGFNVVDNRPKFSAGSIILENNFNPVIGLGMIWKSGIRTNISYTKSKRTRFLLSNTRISERVSREFKMNFNYRLHNFKIPFFRELKNSVDFTLNTRLTENIEQNFALSSDLSAALEKVEEEAKPGLVDFDPLPLPKTGQSHFTISTLVGYQFSDTIKANFEYQFRKLMPKSSRLFERTDHDIQFNIVISIRS